MPASSGPRRQAPRASDAVEKVPVLSKVVRRSSRNPQRGKTRTNKPVTAEAERKPSAVIDMVQSSLGEDLPLGRRASSHVCGGKEENNGQIPLVTPLLARL